MGRYPHPGHAVFHALDHLYREETPGRYAKAMSLPDRPQRLTDLALLNVLRRS